MNNTTSLWSRPGEEAPADTASAQAIADFIFDEVEGGGLLWRDDEKFFRPITTRQAKEFCEAHKYPWLRVAPLLRQRRGRELALSITDPNLTRSVGGIVINTSLVDVMRDFGWLPRCPKVLTGFHKSTYRNFTVVNDCGKWWCPDCGVERLEGLLDQVAERIRNHEALYTASAPYDPRLPARMRYRWKTAQAQCFWYRRNDGMVFYVATAPLDGSREPREWTSRSPTGVVEDLKTVFVFPAYLDHDWSAGWKLKTGTTPRPRDDDTESQWMFLPLTHTQAELVVDLVRAAVKQRFDINLDLGVPPELGDEVKAMFDATVEQVRRDGYGASG